MLLHDDILFNLDIGSLFLTYLPDYDPFGETVVNEEQWNQIVKEAKSIGGEIYLLIEEAIPWVRGNFKRESVFTIIGI